MVGAVAVAVVSDFLVVWFVERDVVVAWDDEFDWRPGGF